MAVKRSKLGEALVVLGAAGRPDTQAEVYIYRDGRFLASIPDLWSSYRERAFVFGSEADAQRLIEEFPGELANAKVWTRVAA
jgi:hypothetical protein